MLLVVDYSKGMRSGWMWVGDSKCKVGRYLYSKESDYIEKKERRVDERGSSITRSKNAQDSDALKVAKLF